MVQFHIHKKFLNPKRTATRSDKLRDQIQQNWSHPDDYQLKNDLFRMTL